MRDTAEGYFPADRHRTSSLAAALVLTTMVGAGACGVGLILRRRDVR